MSKGFKIATIIIYAVFLLGSIYMIPSFFSDAFKGIFLEEAYKILVVIYFGYSAFTLGFTLYILFSQESGKFVKVRKHKDSDLNYHHEYEQERRFILKTIKEQKEAPIVNQPPIVQVVQREVIPEPQPVKKEINYSKLIVYPKVGTFEFKFLGQVYHIKNGWKDLFETESKKPYFKQLERKLIKEYSTKKVYPAKIDIFRAFELTDLSEIKCVILCKIPYYRKDQADGLAYSTKLGSPIHFTTKVVLEELSSDLGIKMPRSGSLVSWAREGVFLLNMSLTCNNATQLSHLDDWLEFTKLALEKAIRNGTPKVYLLWGEYAAGFEDMIPKDMNLVLKAANPSPLSSTGFSGMKPFTDTNEFLVNQGISPINWELK